MEPQGMSSTPKPVITSSTQTELEQTLPGHAAPTTGRTLLVILGILSLVILIALGGTLLLVLAAFACFKGCADAEAAQQKSNFELAAVVVFLMGVGLTGVCVARFSRLVASERATLFIIPIGIVGLIVLFIAANLLFGL